MSRYHWNATYGTIIELTENDEGYDFSLPDVVQLAWEKP